MRSFSAIIEKMGVNPYVLLPESVLQSIFKKAGKEKGAIPVRGTLNRKKFLQTLVKYSGKWRLYLNTPMRNAAGIDVGDIAHVKIEFDPQLRIIEMHPLLLAALKKDPSANAAFEILSPSRQKEIKRYITNLKTEGSVMLNVAKIIRHLLGKERFAGRDR
jgi:hypothetical protein